MRHRVEKRVLVLAMTMVAKGQALLLLHIELVSGQEVIAKRPRLNSELEKSHRTLVHLMCLAKSVTWFI